MAEGLLNRERQLLLYYPCRYSRVMKMAEGSLKHERKLLLFLYVVVEHKTEDLKTATPRLAYASPRLSKGLPRLSVSCARGSGPTTHGCCLLGSLWPRL